MRYFGLKILEMTIMLWLVLTFLFVLFRTMPGDYANRFILSGASPETVQALRAHWGLDQPLHIQYKNYILNFITGDVGTSFQYSLPVINVVGRKVANTFVLAFPAITLGYLLGSVFGAIIGTKRGSRLERYSLFPLFAVGTFPEFFLSIIAIIVFSVWFGWFPTGGMTSAGFTLGEGVPWWRVYFMEEFLNHYILPFSVVFLQYTFLPVVVMRTSVVETMGQSFIHFQRISGLPWSSRIRQIIKHSSLPVITMYPLSMARAIGGLVLVETVFNWPGIGYELVQSVLAQDYPLIQFMFFLIAAMVILLNAVVDVLYGVIDPRVSVEE